MFGRRLLRGLGRVVLMLAYGLTLVGVLGLTSYSSFSLFVRAGALLAPEVIGLPVDEASAVLEQRGLLLRHVAEEDRYDDTIEAGAVVQQDPGPGSTVKQGGKVTVMLSLGPRRVKVPDVRGQRLQSALAELTSSGLPVAHRARVYWRGGEAGEVVAQSPAPGTADQSEPEVDLLVAIDDPGAVYVMPDLVDRRAEPLRRLLEARGFHFGSVKYEAYEGVEEGVILRHTPLPGHPLRRSDWITLVVATSAER